MENLTPAQRVIVIAIGLALTALIAVVVLPWLHQEIEERLPDTPTPLPTSTPTRTQPTRTPTTRPTTATPSLTPSITVTPAASTGTPATPEGAQPTDTPTPFRTQGMDLDGHNRSI